MFKMRDTCGSERKRIESLLVGTGGSQCFAAICSKADRKKCSLYPTAPPLLFFPQPMFMVFVYFFPSAVLEFIFFVILNCHISYLRVLSCERVLGASEAVFAGCYSVSPSSSTLPPPHSLLRHSFAMPFHPLPSFCWAPFELFKSGLERCSIPFKWSTEPSLWIAWLGWRKEKSDFEDST